MAASLDTRVAVLKNRVAVLESRIGTGGLADPCAIFLIGLDVPEDAPKRARWAGHQVCRLTGEALAAFQERSLATFQAMPQNTAGAPLLIALETEP